jgi:hypothetical protein
MRHIVRIQASKYGSIEAKYAEVRLYAIDVEGHDAKARALIVDTAIYYAYNDGLEHVLVTHIDGVPTFNTALPEGGYIDWPESE